MAWRSLQWDNFYSCLLWSSSLCSLLTFKDRHIRCWNGRIQVTSWEVCDHQKHWNALHLFLNWKLTWTTMLYLPTTCSCSKGSFFLFLKFFLNTEKAGEYHAHFSTPRYVYLPLPHVPSSVWAKLQAWFWVSWHPSSYGKHLSGLGSCLTLLASFNMILYLPFVAYYSLIHWERAVCAFNKSQILAALLS